MSSTLDQVTLEFILHEDEPHPEVPRLGDRVAVTIESNLGVTWRARYEVTHLSEATSGDGKAIVVADLDEYDAPEIGTGVAILPPSIEPPREPDEPH